MLKYRLASFLFAALLALPAQAESPVDTILAAAKSSCERLDSGRFDPGDSVQRLDLTGNGSPGTIVDESRFSCSSARSLYAGAEAASFTPSSGTGRGAFRRKAGG